MSIGTGLLIKMPALYSMGDKFPKGSQASSGFRLFMCTFPCGSTIGAFSLLVLFVFSRKAGAALHCRSREGEGTGQHVGVWAGPAKAPFGEEAGR
jgi:hypothetical protein